MARVFLSHSSKDKPFVRELHRRLVRDGVTCFFDEESIEWGANFVTTLEQGIDECEFFVALPHAQVRLVYPELLLTNTKPFTQFS